MSGNVKHNRRRFLGKRSCQNGEECRTWFTCGRKHDFPCVDHGHDDCALDYLHCIAEHFRHECAHDFRSGPWVDHDRGGSASCVCGLTVMDHDMRHAP